MTTKSAILLLLLTSTAFPFVPTHSTSRRPSVSINANEQGNAQDKKISYVRYPGDRSIVLDHNGKPLSVDRMLATKPLRKDISTRPGPGGQDLLYLSGETVIHTLNQVFGYDGWNLQVLDTQQQLREQLDDQRWCVVYTAHVRITLTESGTFKEDYGTGDAMDRQLSAALQMSLKASITDAIKRAARHLGDKFGNCLYQNNFKVTDAPRSFPEALDRVDQGR
jgi:DNA recombination protein Rad52